MRISRKLALYLLPLIVFLGLGLFLWNSLGKNHHLLPSALLNKSVPKFRLPTLSDPKQFVTNREFLGHVSMLNIWASWCFSCRMEHQLLIRIAASQVVPIYGLDYKDNRGQAQQWLTEVGNPYVKNAFDGKGLVAINFGVYGTPETFIIDQHGIVRYRYIGPLTQHEWQDKVLPLVHRLQARKQS